jgi:hypothetical protein
VLCVDSKGGPGYTSLGDAAWLRINIAGDAIQLNNEVEIPSEHLSVNSMTYKGTFGSFSSATSGDLPTFNVLDSDFS